MAVYLVTCALRATDHDYAPLWEALGGAGAARALESTWILDVSQTLEEVNRAVLTHLAPGDRAFVVELDPHTRWAATHLLDEADTWLKTRMAQAGG